MIPTLGRISSLKQYHYSWWLNQPISTTGATNRKIPGETLRRCPGAAEGRVERLCGEYLGIQLSGCVRGGLTSGGQVGPRMMYIYIYHGTQNGDLEDDFHLQLGDFTGCMLVLRGVYKNITFMSIVWNIAVLVGKDTRWGSRSFVEKNVSTKTNILKAIHVPWASSDWWLHVWKMERIDQNQKWLVHVKWCVSNPKDPWDERYIYLHESLIFLVN